MSNPITPCLWFDNQAEDAARFYTSVFKNSRITDVSRYGKEGSKLMSDPSRVGRVTTAFMQMKKFDIEKLINA